MSGLLPHDLVTGEIPRAGPRQEIDGETVETASDFIVLGSKITADGDCSHEIKRQQRMRLLDGITEDEIARWISE